jgi:hypothetical protein
MAVNYKPKKFSGARPKSEGKTKVQRVMDLRNSWKVAERKVTKVTMPTFDSKAAKQGNDHFLP